jgi:hypothetical protein
MTTGNAMTKEELDDGGLNRRRRASERPRMTPRNISIITGVAMLATQAAFLIVLQLHPSLAGRMTTHEA